MSDIYKHICHNLFLLLCLAYYYEGFLIRKFRHMGVQGMYFKASKKCTLDLNPEDPPLNYGLTIFK